MKSIYNNFDKQDFIQPYSNLGRKQINHINNAWKQTKKSNVNKLN